MPKIKQKIANFVSRMAGRLAKTGESREKTTGLTRDMGNLSNQKTAETAALGDIQLGAVGLSLVSNQSISENKKLSRSSNGVEVGGIEPPDILMTSKSPHQATPTPDSLSQNESTEANVPVPEAGPKETSDGESSQSEAQDRQRIGESRAAGACPYCESKSFVKRGLRKNRYQEVQLYLCKNEECGRTFTAQDVKGKHFPLNIVIEGLSYYNLGFTFEESCKIIAKNFGVNPLPETLSAWVDEYKELCRYERLRPYAVKMYKPRETIETVTMAHRQLYRFRYHRAKTALMLTEFGNRNLRRLQEYLNAVSSETPHQYFTEGERMSDVRSKFSTADMIVKSKTNYANRLAAFVLQTVSENKARHEALQRFFIANDSVTVATEVPVYIRKEDVEYMENVLKFKITNADVEIVERPSADIEVVPTALPGEAGQGTSAQREGNVGTGRPAAEIAGSKASPDRTDGTDSTKRNVGTGTPRTITLKGSKKSVPFPGLLTGHIDLIQIRNGQVHIMDYKPHAAKERPIEQLTWYALALSRLTGLRLFEFTCAWFDEKDYYQFFPLHVVKKLQNKGVKKRKRMVHFKDGTKVEVPRENLGKVIIA